MSVDSDIRHKKFYKLDQKFGVYLTHYNEENGKSVDDNVKEECAREDHCNNNKRKILSIKGNCNRTEISGMEVVEEL